MKHREICFSSYYERVTKKNLSPHKESNRRNIIIIIIIIIIANACMAPIRLALGG